jgi:hypothetical protein
MNSFNGTVELSTFIPCWEYRVETMQPTDHDLSDRLNQLGRDGWELVCATATGSRWVFKRPVDET